MPSIKRSSKLRATSGEAHPRRRKETRAALLVAVVLLLLTVGSLLVAGEWLAGRPAPSVDPGSAAAESEDAPVPTRAVAAATATAAAATATAVPPLASPVPRDRRFAVLLLGYGGGGHDGTYLTDAMMVVVVDPDRKTLTLLSLPRDAWVPLVFDGRRADYDKINTAYAYARDPKLYPNRLSRYQGDRGAGTFARETVSRVLGIPIASYLALDFQGFRDLVDAVGGVDVVVASSFSARYPRNDDPSVDPGWKTVRFAAGPQHMDGERALEFTRARLVLDSPSEGSDFARAARQRIVLTALKNRLLQPEGLLHLPQLLGIVQRASDTDYQLPGAADLAGLALSWQEVRFYQAALSVSNYVQEATGPDGEYVVVPKTPGASWAVVRAFDRRLWADPALGEALAGVRVAVANRSGRSGLAGQVSDRLSALGYAVAEPEAGPAQPRTVLRDQSGGRAGPLLDALRGDLGLRSAEVVVDKPAEFPRVVVELGEDAVGAVDASLPPADAEAPESASGIVRFGQWVPAPEPTATPTPAPSGTPGPRPLASPTLSPLPTGTTVATPTPRPKVATPTPTPRPVTPTRR